MHHFWPHATRLFSICSTNQTDYLPGREVGPTDYQRYERMNWGKFWRRHSTPQVLLVWLPALGHHAWEEQFLDRAETPPLVIVWEGAANLLSQNMDLYRSWCKRLERWGYGHVLKHLKGVACGAPVWSSYLLTLFYQQSLTPSDELLFAPLGHDGQGPRGIANCLLYVDIPRWTWARQAISPLGEEAIREAPNHMGHCEGLPVYKEGGPAPPLACMVSTRRGVRRLTPTEW